MKGLASSKALFGIIKDKHAPKVIFLKKSESDEVRQLELSQEEMREAK